MELNKILFLFIFLFSQNAFTFTKLPELITKQSITSLKYITSDGKYTYYQRRNGQLVLSTNYKVFDILKGIPSTEYNIIEGNPNSSIIITQDPNFHQYYSTRKNNQIFVTKIGSEKKISELGKGVSPRLHINNKWLSFFDIKQKKIFIKGLEAFSFSKVININAASNPYFIPKVVMFGNLVLYTDINKKGEHALISFDKEKSKSKLIYKLDSINMNIDICLNGNDLFIFEKGIPQSNIGSSIFKLDVNDLDIQKRKIIYESQLTDRGPLECSLNNELYFIKNFSTKESDSYDVIKLDLNKKNNINKLSDIGMATRFFKMDKKILLPYNGKFYILKGENDLMKKDILELKVKNK